MRTLTIIDNAVQAINKNHKSDKLLNISDIPLDDSKAFDLLKENVGQCSPSRAVPLLSQRATNDNLVIYNGGEDCLTGVCINFLGATATNDVWKQKNQCTNQSQNNNGCQINTQCTDGVEVGLCTTNSGHSPESAQRGWDFMKRFTLP